MEGIGRGAVANKQSLEDGGLPSARPLSWLVSPGVTAMQIEESLARHGPSDHAALLILGDSRAFINLNSALRFIPPPLRTRAANPKSQLGTVLTSPWLVLQEAMVVAWMEAWK